MSNSQLPDKHINFQSDILCNSNWSRKAVSKSAFTEIDNSSLSSNKSTCESDTSADFLNRSQELHQSKAKQQIEGLSFTERQILKYFQLIDISMWSFHLPQTSISAFDYASPRMKSKFTHYVVLLEAVVVKDSRVWSLSWKKSKGMKTSRSLSHVYRTNTKKNVKRWGKCDKWLLIHVRKWW